MPSAQPDPASKPPRKAAKPKSAAKPASAELGIGDLLTELSFLKGLISNLQHEVTQLKQSDSARTSTPQVRLLPNQDHEEGPHDEGSSPESAWIQAGSQELTSQEMDWAMGSMTPLTDEELDLPSCEEEEATQVEEEPEDLGVFAPFEPESFAEDFAAAFEAPVPIDWAKWAAVEEPEEPETPKSRLDSAKKDGDDLQEMIQRHAGLVEKVIEFNEENPPDFFVDSPFDEAVRKMGLTKAADSAPKSASSKPLQPLQTAHDIMAELVAEASVAAAVPGGGQPEDLQLPDLSGFPSDFAGAVGGFGQSGEALEDYSYAPPTDRPTGRSVHLNPDVLIQVPAVQAIRACLLPLKMEEGQLIAGAPKPYDLEAVQLFEEATGMKVRLQAMPIQEVIQGLREGYSTKDGEDFRSSLLSGAAPSVPMTFIERTLSFIPFLQRKS